MIIGFMVVDLGISKPYAHSSIVHNTYDEAKNEIDQYIQRVPNTVFVLQVAELHTKD